MVSFDVVSLYTSINHSRGIEAVRRALQGSHYSAEGREFLLTLLTLNLTQNYFVFEKSLFMQIRGTVMGANVSPIYVNIFVADLEESSIYISHQFSWVLRWWRYIDDIFLLWL